MALLAMVFGSPEEKSVFEIGICDFVKMEEGENSQVFRRRVLDLIYLDKNVIIYNAPTSRKARSKIYSFIKLFSPETPIGSVQVFRTLAELKERNPEKSEEEILAYYKSIQPSKIEVDADVLYCEGTKFFQKDALSEDVTSLREFIESFALDVVKEELELNYQEHESVHHNLSIEGHIDECIKNSKTPSMRLISLMHDLGKGICKDGSKFYSHENVGATYLKNLLWSVGEDINGASGEVVDVVLYHMVANTNGGALPNSVIDRYQVNKPTVDLVEYFSKKIDKESRGLSV